MSDPRVPPLAPAELNDAQAAFLAPFTDRRGRYPNVFGTLARHMDLVDAWSTFGRYTLNGNQLDPRLREVLILRTAVLIGSAYEWHQHARIARRLGMDDATLEHVRAGTPTGDAHVDLMVACAEDLVGAHRLSDPTWSAMNEAFDLTYVLDAVFTVGAYTALGMALNSCGVEIERDE